jgi:tRNA pseudouridine38-40 synthase
MSYSSNLVTVKDNALTRIAMCVEYQGTNYHGWQEQNHTDLTIQAKIEAAISLVAGESISVVCSGRTDAGVHAVGQIIHFDTKAKRKTYNWIVGCNTNLPDDIRISWACEVADTFNARRSARWRRYVYMLSNEPVRPVIASKYLTWHKKKLNENKMLEAAQYLLGEHDFNAFRDSECQSKTTIRCIKDFQITRLGNLIFFDIIANAFLHHMVRNIVGSLLQVGAEKSAPAWIKEVLEKRDRKLAGMTAPANGLFLFEVGYSLDFNLPSANTSWLFNYVPKTKMGEI